jgi:hypothetical protein
MSDAMDGLLRDLGRGTPFPVDWTAYEREVLHRLAQQQARRRRRVWWAAAFGTGIGTAATFVAMVALASFRPVSQVAGPAVPRAEPQLTAPPQAAAVVTEGAKPADAEFRPCIRSIRRADGTVSEIRFAGFSGPGEQTAGLIGVVAHRTR